MNIDPPSPYNTSLTGQFLWQVSRSREWAHPVGKVVFNSTEDGGRQVGSSSREERFRVEKVVSYEQEERC